MGSLPSGESSVTPKESLEEEPFFFILVEPDRLTAGRMTAGRASSSSSSAEGTALVVMSVSSLTLMLLRKDEDLTGRRVNFTVDGDMAGGAVLLTYLDQLKVLRIQVNQPKKNAVCGRYEGTDDLPSLIGSSGAEEGAGVGSSVSSDT